MIYDVKTPSEYMEALEEDWRKPKLLELRNLILDNVPGVAEGIQYKMLSYADAKGVIFHLNAQRNYVSLYVGNASKVDPEGTLLKGIDVGKGCLRFKKSTVVANTRVEEFIKLAVQMWQAGKDIDC